MRRFTWGVMVVLCATLGACADQSGRDGDGGLPTSDLTGVGDGSTASDGGFDGAADLTFLVVDSSQSTVSVSPSTLAADGVAEAVVTVTLKTELGLPVPGRSVTISVSGVSNTIFQPLTNTDANGVTTARIRSTSIGDKTISALTNTLLLDQQPTVTFTAGAPTALVFQFQPEEFVVAGGALAAPLVVLVTDANGNVVANSSVPVSLALGVNPTGAVLMGDVSANSSSGAASFANTFIETAGDGYTLVATSPGLTNATTNPFYIYSDFIDPALSSATVMPATAIADGAATATVEINLQDQYGNPIVDADVTISATGTSNTIVQPAVTNAAGQTSGTIRSTKAEDKTLTITVFGSVPLLVQPIVSFIAGPPSIEDSSFTFSNDDASKPPLTLAVPSDSATMRLVLRDAFGNPCDGLSAQVSLTLSGAGNAYGALTDTAGGVYTRTVSSTVAERKIATATAPGNVTLNIPTNFITPATVSTVSVLPNGSGCVPVDYTISRAGGGKVDVVVEYSPNGSGTWSRAALASNLGQGVRGLTTSTGGTAHTFGWSATSDLPHADRDVSVRVTALVDGYAGPSAVATNSPVRNAAQLDSAGSRLATVSPMLDGALLHLNHDGNVDLVFAASAGVVSSAFGDGVGGFTQSLDVGVPVPRRVAVGDFNRDGWDDVVVSHVSGVSILLNAQDGTLQAPLTTVFGGTTDVEVLDLDRDGDLDVVAVVDGVFGVGSFLNDGLGTLSAPVMTLFGSTGVSAIASGDFNRDGWTDLVATSDNLVTPLRNDSGVLVALPATGTAFVGASDLQAGDLDGDGIPDLVIAGSAGIAPYLGDGSLNFIARPGISGDFRAMVAIADIDQDGALDAVGFDNATTDVVLAHNDRAGDLSQQTIRSAATGADPTRLLVRDADRDGVRDVDLVLSGGAGGILGIVNQQVRRCDVRPEALQVTSTPLQSTTLATADFNEDARPDVVVGYTGAQNPTVHLGTIERLGGAIALPSGAAPGLVVTGDFNGDQHFDVLVGNTTARTFTLHSGDGTGAFSAQLLPFTLTSNLVGLAAARIYDGVADDFGVVDAAGVVTVFKNNGAGTFSVGATLPAIAGATRAISFRDLDNDFYAELIVTSASATTLVVARNLANGSNGFAAPVSYAVGNDPSAVAAADLDADGYLDLAVANRASNSVIVWYSNKDGTFADATTISMPGQPIALVAADLDGDGRPDLATANQQSSAVGVLRNTGARTFASASITRALASLTGIAATELSGDLRADLFAISGDGTVAPIVSSALGFLSGVNVTTEFANVFATALSDVNRDGKLDVVADFGDSQTLSVHPGVGNGRYLAPSAALATAGQSRGLVTGDFNRDGIPDLAASVYAQDRVRIYLGVGDGSFTSASDFSVFNAGRGDGPYGIVTGDFNRDGILDLATANASDGSGSVLLGAGDGSFSAATTFSLDTGLGAGVRDLVAVDLNADGLLDLAFADGVSIGVEVSFGLGDGTFDPPVYTSTVTRSNWITSADLDRDGDIDLLTADLVGAEGRVKVLLNDGAGNLSVDGSYSTGSPAWGIGAADLDGDGVVEILVTHHDESAVDVYLSNGDGTIGPRIARLWIRNPIGMRFGDLDRDGNEDVVFAGSISDSFTSVLSR